MARCRHAWSAAIFAAWTACMASHRVFISQVVVSATPGTRCERIGCRGRLSQWLSENSTGIDSSTKQLINMLHQAEIEIKEKDLEIKDKDLEIKDKEKALEIKDKEKEKALLKKDLAQLEKDLHRMTAEKPSA